MKTPALIANRTINEAIRAGTVRSWNAPDDTLTVWDAHKLITDAIEADRAQLSERLLDYDEWEQLLDGEPAVRMTKIREVLG